MYNTKQPIVAKYIIRGSYGHGKITHINWSGAELSTDFCPKSSSPMRYDMGWISNHISNENMLHQNKGKHFGWRKTSPYTKTHRGQLKPGFFGPLRWISVDVKSPRCFFSFFYWWKRSPKRLMSPDFFLCEIPFNLKSNFSLWKKHSS